MKKVDRKQPRVAHLDVVEQVRILDEHQLKTNNRFKALVKRARTLYDREGGNAPAKSMTGKAMKRAVSTLEMGWASNVWGAYGDKSIKLNHAVTYL